MAQHDYVIANQSGAAFRADLNNGLAAIVTLNSGATEPSTTYAYMFWADTTAGLLKMRNGANNAWITLRELDGTLVFEDGTAAAPALAFASDLNTGIYRIGADSIGITTGGVNRLLANSSGQVAVTLAGSAGTPSFTKDDDLNTGLFYPAADTLAISAGGTEAARIDSSRRLLVGTTATGDDNSALQIRNDSGSQIEVFRASADAVGTVINCAKSRGTASAPAEVNSGDVLGQINFRGYDGAAWQTAARIEANASASWTDAGDTTDNPGNLRFYTVDNGTSSLTAKFEIDGDGYTSFRGACAAEVFPVIIGGYDDGGGEHGHMIINGYGSSNYAGDIYFEKYRGTPNSPTIVQSGDFLGGIHFNGYDGTAPRRAADISIEVDGTPGANDMPGRIVLSTTADGAAGATERMRIDNAGNVFFNTTNTDPSGNNVNGCAIGNSSGNYLSITRSGSTVGNFNRKTNDGAIIDLRQDGVAEGNISVSGTTVSYNGAHLSRWSQLPGGAEREEILRGTVLSNIDEMCEWGEEDNEQLNRMKVSDVEGDVNVAGVFQDWDDDDDTYTDDFYCAMTGDFIIRIAEGVTVQRGDLLMSAGDGTAKPQNDDIIRSKTVAKVTSTQVSCTYEDGSYCVPCVLMAC